MRDVQELLDADAYARSLGATILEARPDRVRVGMEVAAGHLDHRGLLSPGIVFSLADCAMSFVSNAERRAVAVAVHLVHGDPVPAGSRIEATATPEHRSGPRVTWRIPVTSSAGGLAGLFTGTTLDVPG